jgi:hydrophobic/amphiphilic exporter-1 (mainly G- bacteria), HAE1 family
MADQMTVSAPPAERGIASLFVRRPVLAIVLNLLIVIAGVAAFMGIEVRELPNTDRPVITIRTSYDGATPETVDKEITAIVEGAVARTPGVVSISSQSSARLQPRHRRVRRRPTSNVAANDLRDAVGSLRSLPDDADAPVIVKADTDGDAIMRLAATSDAGDPGSHPLRQRPDRRPTCRRGRRRRRQVFGDRRPLVQIILDPDALAARGLTVSDLNTALATVTLDAPAGSISDGNRTFLVRADASAKSAEEIGAILINQQTRVSDVADVVFGPADRETSLRINGKTGLGIGIVRQARANTLDISAAVHATVDELNASLPEDVSFPLPPTTRCSSAAPFTK